MEEKNKKTEYFARKPEGSDNILEWQTLPDHLNNVAEKAADFANYFGLKNMAYFAGLWHDIGKYSRAFQRRLAEDGPRTDHSTAGAQHAQGIFKEKGSFEYYIGRILAYAIAAHHSGLANGLSTENSCLEERLRKKIESISSCPDYFLKKPELSIKNLKCFCENRRDKRHLAFGLSFSIRMVFSCLVDADRLDAEACDDKIKSIIRQNYPSLQQCADGFFRKLDTFSNSAEPTEVNLIRKVILDQCLLSAKCKPGLFSLTVPTGGGKTLSSMAFALKHALNEKHEMRRIIYVIPYTSIIEQNAKKFKEFIGEDAVLEHHCNVVIDEKENTQASKFEILATENWDAPIIVTTSVQFFESLFSSKPSQCRKLHNIARSVVIIDEAQMLPPKLLLPIIEILRELNLYYGTSVVLCTATQPAITVNDDFKNGLDNVHEIINNPQALAVSLKRTNVKMSGEKSEEEICRIILETEQVLCIVNTKGRARKIFESCRMGKNVFHLSAAMYPVHRSQTISAIKTCLKDKFPCHVISTQLVEAGVDIDFPLVLREIAGMDSIHQAAGRCNREGELRHNGKKILGNVIVFEFLEGVPKLFRQQSQITASIARQFPDDVMELQAITEYFKKLFWQSGRENLDINQILEKIAEGHNSLNFPFEQISNDFKLIPENKSIFIPYDDEAKKLLKSFEAGVESKSLFRKAQRYSVSVYENDFNKLADAQAIKPVFENYYFLDNIDLYDKNLGLKIDDPFYRVPESNIA